MVDQSGPEDKDVNKAPGSSLDLTLLITHCFCAASLQPAQVADEPTAAADCGGGCGRLRPSPWLYGPRPVPGSYYYQPFNARPSRSGLLERSLLAYLTSSAYQLQLTELRKPGCECGERGWKSRGTMRGKHLPDLLPHLHYRHWVTDDAEAFDVDESVNGSYDLII